MFSKKYTLYIGSTKEQPLSWGKVRAREEIFTNDQELLFTDRFKHIITVCNQIHPLTDRLESVTKNELLQNGFLIAAHGNKKTKQIINDLFDIITSLDTPQPHGHKDPGVITNENQARLIYRLTLLILIDQIRIRKGDADLNNDTAIKKVYLNNLTKIKKEILAHNNPLPLSLTITSRTIKCLFAIPENFVTYIDQLTEEDNIEECQKIRRQYADYRRAHILFEKLKESASPNLTPEMDWNKIEKAIQNEVDKCFPQHKADSLEASQAIFNTMAQPVLSDLTKEGLEKIESLLPLYHHIASETQLFHGQAISNSALPALCEQITHTLPSRDKIDTIQSFNDTHPTLSPSESIALLNQINECYQSILNASHLFQEAQRLFQTQQAASQTPPPVPPLNIQVDFQQPAVTPIDNLDHTFIQVIQDAVDEYTNQLQKKGGWTGLFVHHGKKGLEKTASLKEQVIGKDFDQICILLRSFYSDTFTAPQQFSPIGLHLGGTARAHKHSFISFLLNKLKNHPELIDELNKKTKKKSLPARNIQSISDFTKSSANQIRAQAFDFFKTLPIEQHKTKNLENSI